MIVNRFDEYRLADNSGFGVGFQLFDNGVLRSRATSRCCSRSSICAAATTATASSPSIAAPISGSIAVEWAKHMTGWGVVVAIEAQERIYYALAGNLAINNCFNARAIHAAVTNAARQR